jgi:acyl-CoA synthetase (AMP-forming)/AMP-acid ligase II
VVRDRRFDGVRTIKSHGGGRTMSGREPHHHEDRFTVLDLRPTSLTLALEFACALWPHRTAIVDGRTTYQYEKLWSASGALADYYTESGVEPGAIVACKVRNSVSVLLSALACWRIGAVHCGLDADLTLSETVRQLRLSRAFAVIADGTLAEDLLCRTPVPDEPWRSHVFKAGELEMACKQAELPLRLGIRASRPSRERYSPCAAVWPQPAASVFLTSGTTGGRKAVVQYHLPTVAGVLYLAQLLRMGPSDVHLAQLPLSHAFGFHTAISGLVTGGSLILQQGFQVEEAASTIRDGQVTIFNGSPTHYRRMLDLQREHPGAVPTGLRGIGSAAPFSRELVERVAGELGMRLVVLYGSTEGFGMVLSDSEQMPVKHLDARQSPNVRVTRPDGSRAELMEAGEISILTTRRWRYLDDARMAELGGHEAPTWIRTGDRGLITAEGELVFRGRVTGQINRGGLKIDPTEVEEAIFQHDAIADVAVIGLPDDEYGERVCACISAKDRQRVPTILQLRDFLGSSLARHKLPDEIILTEIPRDGTGKPDWARLRMLAAR